MNKEVSLSTLLDEGLVQPGEGVLSLDLQGTTYTSDLLENGSISWNGKIFSDVLNWLTQLKLTYNLTKSFPVWTNIRYNGVKLHQYRNMYLKKISESVPEEGCRDDTELTRNATIEAASNKTAEVLPTAFQELNAANQLSHFDPNSFQPQLLECAIFDQLGLQQPYSISIQRSVILNMNFHSHLVIEEVSGYLAGCYNHDKKHMDVLEVFPCCCDINDKDESQECEIKIREAMNARKLRLVGWYHSHPDFEARPTYQDVVLQKKYQATVSNLAEDEACIAFVISCRHKGELNFYHQSNCFWVKSLDQASGVPMLMGYNVSNDISDIIDEEALEQKFSYYRKRNQSIDFSSIWRLCINSLPSKPY